MASCPGLGGGSGSNRGRFPTGPPSCPVPCGNVAPVCPLLPCVPEQGSVMPVLYNPGQYTNIAVLDPGTLAVYTLNLVTTATIPVGITLRFQMYNGIMHTYSSAHAASNTIQWDLVVSQAIPVATIVVVNVTPTSTSLVGFTGTATYASGGAGIASTFLSPQNALLCWAFAPTATGGWTPAAGSPQFAIGFNFSEQQQGTVCDAPPVTPASIATAPNFPDQWCLTSPTTWTFLYEIIFPTRYSIVTEGSDALTVCQDVTGIKIAEQDLYAIGEWSNLRDQIAQAWTAILPHSTTPSRWVGYGGDTFTPNPNVGPFILAAEPGQLVVVYFQPSQQDRQAVDVRRPAGNGTVGRLGLLVTSPLPPHSITYFTMEPYNSYLGGFGPRDTLAASTAPFVDAAYDFAWTTGPVTVPAGTVVFLDNIGSPTIPVSIVDAHNTASNLIGGITGQIPLENMPATGFAVPSIIITSAWNQSGVGYAKPLLPNNFVTAIMSADYNGDMPPLSPMLTMQRTRVAGPVAYGLGRLFDNANLPGTVQAAMINSAMLTPLTLGESNAVNPSDMPVFTNMGSFRW